MKLWSVAQAIFPTDHCNVPTQITRWTSASSLWGMLEARFCYFTFIRQLIALLSVRCLKCTLHSVTYSPDLFVFLTVEASVARQWRHDAEWAVSIFRENRKASPLLLGENSHFTLGWMFFFLPFPSSCFIIEVYKCLQLSEDLVRNSKKGYQH